MHRVISSFLPFPNLTWWQYVIAGGGVSLDKAEHYEKMSYRNRYYIATANGKLALSIPLSGGRSQKGTMAEVQISNKDNWQKQHWRTITSAYKRSPYFEYYEPSLAKMYENQYERLIDFNLDSIKWSMQQMQLKTEFDFLNSFKKNYEDTTDLRFGFLPSRQEKGSIGGPQYQQVFQEHLGFLPNLSILDLLCANGPYSLNWLRTTKP